jgi:large-conductance mechanosensitive channel
MGAAGCAPGIAPRFCHFREHVPYDQAAAPPAPTKEEQLLAEIRDVLKERL